MPSERQANLTPTPEAAALLERVKGLPPADQRASERTQERQPAREYYRSMARVDAVPDGALKYHIDRRDFIPDCDHEWVAVRVNGMPSGQLRRALSHGWVPARACDFVQLSGYGVEYGENLRRAGYVPNIQADDPIEIDGEMLMVRAAELSRRADKERQKAAEDQVRTQMERLELASRRSLGERSGRGGTEVRYGRLKQYANRDLDDAFGPDGEV